MAFSDKRQTQLVPMTLFGKAQKPQEYPTMKTTLNLFVLSASLAILSGCATLPLGVSKSEWGAMSPKQQAEYRRLEKIAGNQRRLDAETDRRYAEQAVKRAESQFSSSSADYSQPR